VSGFANPSLGDDKQQTLTANLDNNQIVVLTITVSTGVDNYSLSVGGVVGINDAASLQPVIDPGPAINQTASNTTCSQSSARR
jgi:hypothetical protein